MKKAILATKVGMTQIFDEDGSLIPVTVLEAGPCVVTQVKTEENDGYKAVQVGFIDKKDRIVNKDAKGKKEVIHAHGVGKAMQGHFKAAGTTSKRYVREFRFENSSEYELGQEIKADIFAEGDKIDATAITKGKGFQGATKRWGIKLLSHRNSKHRRGIGNLGPKRPGYVRSTVPLPGQMGYHQRTELNKKIIKVGTDGKEVSPKGGFMNYGEVRNTYVLIKGSVPGPTKRLIRFRDAARLPKKADTGAAEVTYVSTESKQGA